MVSNTITLEILAANLFKANIFFGFFGFTEKKWDSRPSVVGICGFNTGNAAAMIELSANLSLEQRDCF